MEKRKKRRPDEHCAEAVDTPLQRVVLPVENDINQPIVFRSKVVPSDVEGQINRPVSLTKEDVSQPKLRGHEKLVDQLDDIGGGTKRGGRFIQRIEKLNKKNDFERPEIRRQREARDNTVAWVRPSIHARRNETLKRNK